MCTIVKMETRHGGVGAFAERISLSELCPAVLLNGQLRWPRSSEPMVSHGVFVPHEELTVQTGLPHELTGSQAQAMCGVVRPACDYEPK